MGYTNYEVSSLGRVRSLGFDIYHPSKIITPHINNKGYFYVGLYKNKKQTKFLVHRLVAIAFIPNPNNYPCVNHKDCNPQNCCVENLEWVSHIGNMSYPPTRERLSEAHKGLMLNYPGFSKPVAQYTLDGILVAIYPSIHEAERQTKIRNGDIYRCCKGQRHTAGGYIWQYV